MIANLISYIPDPSDPTGCRMLPCLRVCGDVSNAVPPVTGQRRVVAGAQVIAIDASVKTLTPPTSANVAEISVEGTGIRWTTDGQNPDNNTGKGHRSTDWGRIELESFDEVTNFRFVSLGGTGRLYVEYFSVPYLGMANA